MHILRRSITFLWNKKNLNLCLRCHILRSYRFVPEVTCNGKKTEGAGFLAKNLILEIMPKNTQTIWFLQKKKNIPLIWRFFGFKSCTIMTFMILLKPHVWEKSGNLMPSANQIAGFLNCSISKTIRGIKLIFCMRVHIY